MNDIAPADDEVRPEDDLLEDDAQFAEDRTLTPEFVRSVAAAIDA